MHIIHRVFHTVMLTATHAQKWSKVRGSDKRVYNVAGAWYDGEKRREGDSVMKPVFATDLTENKHNTEPNGREFLTQEPSDALRRRHEEMLGRMNETMEKSQLAKPLRVVEYVCSMGWLITLCGILRAVLKADHPTAQLRQAYRNAPEVFWVFGVCLLIWAALHILGRRKSKQVLETEESERVFARTENSMSAIYDELDVPPDAQEVDVLTFFYKEKGGECKVCEKTMQMLHILTRFSGCFSTMRTYIWPIWTGSTPSRALRCAASGRSANGSASRAGTRRSRAIRGAIRPISSARATTASSTASPITSSSSTAPASAGGYTSRATSCPPSSAPQA